MAKQAERISKTKSAIITAATDLFGANGFDPTTMDDIVRRSGTAKGGVYHHFPTKTAIFEAVFHETYASLVTRTAAAAKGHDDPLAAMTAAIHAYFDACAHPATGRIILKDGPAVLGWDTWRKIDASYFGGGVRRSLAAAMEAQLIAAQPLEPLSRILLGAITEAAVACADSDNYDTKGKEYGAALERLIDALRI